MRLLAFRRLLAIILLVQLIFKRCCILASLYTSLYQTRKNTQCTAKSRTSGLYTSILLPAEIFILMTLQRTEVLGAFLVKSTLKETIRWEELLAAATISLHLLWNRSEIAQKDFVDIQVSGSGDKNWWCTDYLHTFRFMSFRTAWIARCGEARFTPNR